MRLGSVIDGSGKHVTNPIAPCYEIKWIINCKSNGQEAKNYEKKRNKTPELRRVVF
jgi:hypothetical protein